MPANNEQTNKGNEAAAAQAKKEVIRPTESEHQRNNMGKGNGGTATDQSVIAQVQESGREIASKSMEAIGDRTRTATAGYKSDISSGLHTLADGLRQTSSTFQQAAEDKPISTAGARYIEDIAKKIEGVSDYFERTEASDLINDMKGFARRNPAVFVGGAFAMGFAISRLIRSAGEARTEGGA